MKLRIALFVTFIAVTGGQAVAQAETPVAEKDRPQDGRLPVRAECDLYSIGRYSTVDPLHGTIAFVTGNNTTTGGETLFPRDPAICWECWKIVGIGEICAARPLEWNLCVTPTAAREHR